MGIVFIVPPVTDELLQHRGVGENNGKTDGETSPQFVGGRDDTHSEFLVDSREKRAIFLAKTVSEPIEPTRIYKRVEAYLNSAWKTITNAGFQSDV